MNWDLKIWNFHCGQLLNKIKIMNNGILCICFWIHLFAACENNPFVLIDLKNKIISGNCEEKEKCIMAIKKILMINMVND